MPVKTDEELGEPLRSFWLKAVAAIELRNFGYAIELLENLLKQEPEFLTGRQMLRRAAVTRAEGEKQSFFTLPASPLATMKAQRELQKDPPKAIQPPGPGRPWGGERVGARPLVQDMGVA